MCKHFKLSSIALFLSVIFFISSCKEKNDGTTASTDAVVSTNTPPKVKPKEAFVAGTLDTLWVEATKFKALSNARLVLSFAIEGPDTLTLYGWSCKNSGGNCTGEFSHDPELKLVKGRPSVVGYGPIVFWDNLILEKKDVKAIQDKIGTFTYVLFAPENKNGHINYKIILSAKDPKEITATFTVDDSYTGIDANPSPPKNSSN